MAQAPPLLANLESALHDLRAAEPQALADGEALVILHRRLEQLDAVTTRAAAAFEAAGGHEADGARTAASWISFRCRLPHSTARRRVRLGRGLRHMGLVEEAWLGGEITSAHVSLLEGARTPARAECFERDEEMLLEWAKTLSFSQFARALAYWSYRADPDGAEDRAEAQREGRRVHLSQTFGGCWALDGWLDPISGEIVAQALRRIEDELFEADWAEAKDRVGEEVRVSDLARTPAQRRADALVEMARRAMAVPEGARLPDPLFSVFVGYETFAGMLCQLASGTVVTPGSLVDWLGEGWVERVVFDGPGRVTDVGVRRRIFTGATRRAVQVRDRQCFHPFCEEPAERCQVDHVEPYAAGGQTTQDNGRAACGFHNRRRHRRT